jgi:hypothetical protein
MNDSLLVSDEILTKYSFNFFDEEIELFLTKDELESISKFFELVNSTNYSWDEISESVFKMNPNVAYIINTLAYHHRDKISMIRRNDKLENILK